MGQRKSRTSRSLILIAALAAPLAYGQSNQVTLTLGRVSADDRSFSSEGSARLDSGLAWQANFASRIVGTPLARLDWELHFLASPQRKVSSPLTDITRDFASLYVTPGVKLQFLPGGPFRPFVAGGAGFGIYEHSRETIAGDDNPADRKSTTGVLQFGAGVDIPIIPKIGARFEVRDFYSGNPQFNRTLLNERQHNVVVSGGLWLRF